MRKILGWTLAAALLCGAATPTPPARPQRTPTARPSDPQKVVLSAAEKTQARKVLAAAVERLQTQRGKQAPAAAAPPGFHAHRCAVLYDQKVEGKERAANGPFRATCADWVSRPTKELAIKDAEQPCTPSQYGPGLAGCTSWVDQWDTDRGKLVEIWRHSTP